MAHDGPVLGSAQIEINHLMKGAAVQQAQNFRQRKETKRRRPRKERRRPFQLEA